MIRCDTCGAYIFDPEEHMMSNDINQTSWSPERKVVGGAIGVLAAAIFTTVAGVDPFPGFEGAVGIIAAYLLPDRS